MSTDDDAPRDAPQANATTALETCEVCNSTALVWRKCKLVCMHCRSIVKSCADL